MSHKIKEFLKKEAVPVRKSPRLPQPKILSSDFITEKADLNFDEDYEKIKKNKKSNQKRNSSKITKTNIASKDKNASVTKMKKDEGDSSLKCEETLFFRRGSIQAIRRVPSKIVVHTGLRNTFSFGKIPMDSDPQLNQPILDSDSPISSRPVIRKVILKPHFPYQKSPINPKMITAAEFLKNRFEEGTLSTQSASDRTESIDHKDIQNSSKPSFSSGESLYSNQKDVEVQKRDDFTEICSTVSNHKAFKREPKSSELMKLGEFSKRVKTEYDEENELKLKPNICRQFNVRIDIEKPEKKEGENLKKAETLLGEKSDFNFTSTETNSSSQPASKYTGVFGLRKIRGYEDDRLSIKNPKLAARLSELFSIPFNPNGYDFQIPPSKKSKNKSKETKAQRKKKKTTRKENTYKGNINDDLPNSLDIPKMIKVIFNSHHAEIPNIVFCHLCQSEMRLGMRKSKYRGELREYPAYRCLQKGCQTFRSIRKVLQPDCYLKSGLKMDKSALKLSALTPKDERTIETNSNKILNPVVEGSKKGKRGRKKKHFRTLSEQTIKNEEIVINCAGTDLGDFETNSDGEHLEDEEVEWKEIPELMKQPGYYELKNSKSEPVEDSDDIFEVEEQSMETL